ncbi:hypothetical protein FRC02_000350 [Tulasnella sp. 418]|nr:hypothetical protein FRC02_000350 [Tulasnella sp. 418]
MSTKTPILNLPLEIIQHILICATPLDVASISQTCRAFRDIIYSPTDTHIWKSLFLDLFDDPRIRAEVCRDQTFAGTGENRNHIGSINVSGDYDWKQELQRRIKAAILVNSSKKYRKCDFTKREEMFSAFISVIETSLPAVIYSKSHGEVWEASASKNVAWIIKTLQGSVDFGFGGKPSPGPWATKLTEYESDADAEASDLRCQLQAYLSFTAADEELKFLKFSDLYTPSDDSVSPPSHAEPSQHSADSHTMHSFTISESRARARAEVYGPGGPYLPTRWSPLVPITGQNEEPSEDGEDSLYNTAINWKHIEAIKMVMGWNISRNSGLGTRDSFPPVGLDALRPYSAPRHLTPSFNSNSTPGDEQDSGLSHADWAGVEGKWRRLSSFCTYSSNLSFRFGVKRGNKLYLSAFGEGNFSEATVPRTSILRITSVEPNVAHSNRRPRINFEGPEDRDIEGEAILRGYVEELPSGAIHWHWITSIGGDDTWAGEGVQLGGIQSKAGFLGIWADPEHSVLSPVGKLLNITDN